MTLVEIMVVIACISLLTLVVVHQYTHTMDNGRATATALDLKKIGVYLQAYHLDGNPYPAGAATVDANLFGGYGNRFLSIPPDDQGSPFQYTPAPSAYPAEPFMVCDSATITGDMAPDILVYGQTASNPAASYNECYTLHRGVFLQ